ncbi:unnamed protein product, partial [Thlaspi arvense]
MISELPEDLLLKIFLFVPIKDAVTNAVNRGVDDLTFKLRWPIDPVSLPKSL